MDSNQPNDKENTSFDHLKKTTPFKVPENYFESLQDNVMSKIRTAEAGSNVSSGRTRRLWIPYAAAAAAIAAAFLLFFLLIPKSEEKPHASSMISYSSAIEQYLQNEGDLDSETIMAALLDEGSPSDLYTEELLLPISNDSIPGKSVKENEIILDTTISSDDILQYLLDEGYTIDPNS